MRSLNKVSFPAWPMCVQCKKREPNVYLVRGHGHFHEACWEKARRLLDEGPPLPANAHIRPPQATRTGRGKKVMQIIIICLALVTSVSACNRRLAPIVECQELCVDTTDYNGRCFRFSTTMGDDEYETACECFRGRVLKATRNDESAVLHIGYCEPTGVGVL